MYGIIRVAKIKSKGDMRGEQIHTNRERISRTNPDINYEKTPENKNYIFCEDFGKRFDERIKELQNAGTQKKVRSDAVLMMSGICTASHNFFDNKKKTEQYFDDVVDFLKDKYGKKNLVSATVHYDERTPHLHFYIIPEKEGRLCAKKMFGKQDLINLQDEFFTKVSSKYGLERGEKNSNKKHLSTQDFKKINNEANNLEKKLEKTEKIIEEKKENLEKLKSKERQRRRRYLLEMFTYKSAAKKKSEKKIQQQKLEIEENEKKIQVSKNEILQLSEKTGNLVQEEKETYRKIRRMKEEINLLKQEFSNTKADNKELLSFIEKEKPIFIKEKNKLKEEINSLNNEYKKLDIKKQEIQELSQQKNNLIEVCKELVKFENDFKEKNLDKINIKKLDTYLKENTEFKFGLNEIIEKIVKPYFAQKEKDNRPRMRMR